MKVGDRVEVVDLDPCDAYYDHRDDIIGQVGTIEYFGETSGGGDEYVSMSGWYAAGIALDEPMKHLNNCNAFFYRVGLEYV